MREPEDVGRVDRDGGQGLLGSQVELGAGERADERQARRERAARVEVRRERDRGAGVGERPARRHRPIEEERARRQEHAHDVARGERPDSGSTRRLEVVDRARPQLDRERDRAALRELVAVEAQREPGVAAGDQIAARLRGVERPALEKDIGRGRESRRVGQDLCEREVEVRVGIGGLGRHGVCAEPGRRAARRGHGPKRLELGLAVEPVARLALPGRRSVRKHPAGVALDPLPDLIGVERARRPDGREDPAAGGVQLLVARAPGAERELVDAVAAERRVRVAVDEARDGAEPAPVELLQLAAERRQVAHPPDRLDAVAGAEDEGVLDHLDVGELPPAARESPGGGRRDLREVANEQAPGRGHARRRSSTRRTSASKGRARAPRPPPPGSPRRGAARRPCPDRW